MAFVAVSALQKFLDGEELWQASQALGIFWASGRVELYRDASDDLELQDYYIGPVIGILLRQYSDRRIVDGWSAVRELLTMAGERMRLREFAEDIFSGEERPQLIVDTMYKLGPDAGKVFADWFCQGVLIAMDMHEIDQFPEYVAAKAKLAAAGEGQS